MKITENKVLKILIIFFMLVGFLFNPIVIQAENPTPDQYLKISSYLGGGSFISGLWDQYLYLTDIDIEPKQSATIIIGFDDYSNLKRVKIHENITSISGFKNCINLEELELPSTLKTIAGNSFSGCISLKEVRIPKGVTSIENGAFSNCDSNNLMLILEKDSQAEQFAINSGFEKNVNYKYITYSINDVEINSIPAKTYTGESIRPTIIVKNIDKNGLLKENTNYTVEYGENIKPGKGTIKVTGIENYTESRILEFDIIGNDFTKASVDDINDYVYNGSDITPEVKVTYENRVLKKGEDYNVTYLNNLKVGTATVEINGIGAYSGTLTKTFKIIENSFLKAQVDDIKNYVYNRNNITPEVKVIYENKVLKKGEDYSVTYQNNLKVGTATAVINGIGGYSGKITKNFEIWPKGTTISKLSKDKNKTKVTWKKQKAETTGYEIKYSTNKNFKSGNKTVKINKNKTTSATIKKLKSKKKYYVKIRTYKFVNGRKYYSDWSKAKSIKVK